MDIYTTSILISVLIYLFVGSYAGKKVKHLDDYFVVGRKAPTILIVGTLVASVLSTNAFLGETGFSYASQGGSYILWPATWVAGYIFGALFFGRYLRRSRVLTVAEFFGHRFNSKAVRRAAGVTVVLGLGGYLLAVTQGTAVILTNLTPLNYQQALITSWFCYTFFTLYSGSRGVIITDTIMFLLFTIMSFVAFYYIIDLHGGWLTAFEGLINLESKPDLMSWHGQVGAETEWQTPADYAIWSLITGIAWGLVTAVSPWQSSRYLMAKSEHVVVRSACIAAIVIAVSNLVLFAAATAVNLSKDDIFPFEETMIYAAMNMMPAIVGGLLLAGIMAAALSSSTTFLSLVGFSVSNDIIPSKQKANQQADDKSLLRFSRIVMLVVSVVTLLISFVTVVDIFWLSNYVGTVFASSWGPIAFMSVWSKSITERGAFWGIISGFVGNIIPRFLDVSGIIDLPSYLNPILVGCIISLITIVVVSRFGQVSDIEKQRRLELHQMPVEEQSKVQTKRTQWAGIAVIIFGLLLSIILMIYYVYPYQKVTGTLLNNGNLDWFSAEALLALGWAAIYVPLGILTYRIVNRSYTASPKVSTDTETRIEGEGSNA